MKFNFRLPKIYWGEGWLDIVPFDFHIHKDKDMPISFNSQINICGFFLWQLYFEAKWGGEICILGFTLAYHC